MPSGVARSVPNSRNTPSALGGREQPRDDVGLRPVVLAVRAGRAARVEVAKREVLQAVGRLVPAQRALERPLRLPVAVDTDAPAISSVIGERLRLAVGRRGGGEDEAGRARLDHRVQQVDAADEVGAVEASGVPQRDVHERLGGQVDDGTGALRAHRGPDGLPVEEVQLGETGPRVDRGAVPVAEVVPRRDVVPGVAEELGHDAADVARRPRHDHPRAHRASHLTAATAASVRSRAPAVSRRSDGDLEHVRRRLHAAQREHPAADRIDRPRRPGAARRGAPGAVRRGRAVPRSTGSTGPGAGRGSGAMPPAH